MQFNIIARGEGLTTVGVLGMHHVLEVDSEEQVGVAVKAWEKSDVFEF